MHPVVLRMLATVVALLVGAAACADPAVILVGGVTGRQGGAVAAELSSRGFAVRGMTRRPDGSKARRLAETGIDIVRGDYGEPASLRAAMRGAGGVFFYSGLSRRELAEGMNVVDAARASGVPHVVYSSGAAADPVTGMSGAVKAQVETYLRESGVPFTVLRPVAFMENYRGQQARIIENGVVDSRGPERIATFIAVRDIGFFVGEAFSDPERWLGRAENISGDQMTMLELAATFSRVLGRRVAYHRVPVEAYLLNFPPPLRPLFRWYDKTGYSVDTAGWRARYPGLITLEEYLEATGWQDWQPKP